MKFNTENKPNFPDDEFMVGNVYRCKGGARYPQKFWVVIGIHDGMAIMLGISAEGNITSCAKYGQYVFDGTSPNFQREFVGRATNIGELTLNIEWCI